MVSMYQVWNKRAWNELDGTLSLNGSESSLSAIMRWLTQRTYIYKELIMRKLIAALGVSTAMILPIQAVSAAEVAVLDWRAALMNTQSAQSSLSQLENEIGAKQNEAQSLANELQSLQERLQSQGDSMAQSQRESLVAELQQKGSRFQQLRQEVLQAQQRSEQAFLEQSEAKLEQAVDQVIQRHSIDILVEPQGVLHSSMDLPNLTNEVTEIFNTL